MLDIRIRQFEFKDQQRFTVNLISEIKEGMVGLPPLDPDTDARVVEDILGRVYGILVRLQDTDVDGLFMLFVDMDYPNIATDLLHEHLQRMKDEDGKDI